MGNFLNTMKSLGPVRLAAMAGVAVFLLGFLVFFVSKIGGEKMSLLFSDLESADASKIIGYLDQNNIPYEVRKGGGEIYVPEEQVNKLRITAAEQAFPVGGVGGYEIFDNTDSLGATNFVQNLNMVRALEGELGRTIKSIENVQAARVHLVLPKREIFSREQQPPSASVVVKMKVGTLKQSQVTAIQRIVASAVPKMNPEDVTIVDNKGALLTKEFADDENMMFANNEEIRRGHEMRLTQAIVDLLERTVGMGKVRAEVALDMDFSQVVTNKELYNPEAQVLRSATTIAENNKSDEKEVDVVSVDQNLPYDNDAMYPGGRISSEGNRTEETVNYEISKEVVNQVRQNPVIKRISAAVVVDGLYTEGEEGEKLYSARSKEDMEMISALVRSAIGFDGARGDTVEVVNMQFIDLDALLEEETSGLFLGFTKQEVLNALEGLGVALVAILVIFLVVRPLIIKSFEHAESEGEAFLLMESAKPKIAGPGMQSEPSEEDVQLDELIDIAKVEGRVKASSLRKIGEIIDKHPEEALNIIRNWLYREA